MFTYNYCPILISDKGTNTARRNDGIESQGKPEVAGGTDDEM